MITINRIGKHFFVVAQVGNLDEDDPFLFDCHGFKGNNVLIIMGGDFPLFAETTIFPNFMSNTIT